MTNQENDSSTLKCVELKKYQGWSKDGAISTLYNGVDKLETATKK